MKISISMDYDWDAKIESVIYELRDAISLFFGPRQYGQGIEVIGVVFNCKDIPLTVRKRFHKADKVLTYDIVSDFNLVSAAEGQEKRDIIVGLFKESVSAIMPYKKKISGFDFDNFEKDWNLFFENYN